MRNDSGKRLSSLGEPTFVIDKQFVVSETREALRTFFAPFTGVYRAFRSAPAGQVRTRPIRKVAAKK